MELKIIHDPKQMTLTDVRAFIECFRQLCLKTNVHHVGYVGNTPTAIYFNDVNSFVVEDGSHHCPWNMQEVKPATKEQYDLLFQKMEKAKYKWDAGNKQLIKLL